MFAFQTRYCLQYKINSAQFCCLYIVVEVFFFLFLLYCPNKCPPSVQRFETTLLMKFKKMLIHRDWSAQQTNCLCALNALTQSVCCLRMSWQPPTKHQHQQPRAWLSLSSLHRHLSSTRIKLLPFISFLLLIKAGRLTIAVD